MVSYGIHIFRNNTSFAELIYPVHRCLALLSSPPKADRLCFSKHVDFIIYFFSFGSSIILVFINHHYILKYQKAITTFPAKIFDPSSFNFVPAGRTTTNAASDAGKVMLIFPLSPFARYFLEITSNKSTLLSDK